MTDLKNRLSQYLRLVKKGEVIEVLEHSVPVARLEGVRYRQNSDAQLERLLRDGTVSYPASPSRGEGWKAPPVPCDGDIVEALIDERGDR